MVTNKKLVSLAVLLSFISLECTAQLKYWIRLTDKIGTPYMVSNPSLFLTQKSIARRAAYNIPYDNSDLPVNPSYVNQIKSVPNVTVLYVSKWLNGVVVSIPDKTLAATALATIRGFSFVVDTGRVKRYRVNIPVPEKVVSENDPVSAKGSGSNDATAYNYGGSLTQNEQLNLLCLHENGYRGQGMTIAVLDAGFISVDVNPVFDSLRKNGGILGTRNFCDGGTNVFVNSNHGTAVMSCMAANITGTILGSAPLAKYWLLKTEEGPSETISEEYNWIRGAEFADSVGADILTTSLGYTDFDIPSQNHTYATLNGRTAPMSIAATIAARKGMFVLNAAGNEGDGAWHYISVPGDADSICTVGAVDGSENFQSFSGVGPTADGRIKPDLLARGAGSWVCGESIDCFPGNGTSFATPILAGAVACFWQVNRYLNNIQLLDTLKKLGTRAATPSYTTGWGVPKLTCAPPCPLISNFTYTVHEYGLVDFKSTATGTTSGAQYTWIFGDGTFGSGPSVSHAYPSGGRGIYGASLFVDNKLKQTCNDSSKFVGINLEISFDFTAYSNPVNSVISINLARITYEFVLIEMFDLLGHRVFMIDQKNGQTDFDLDSSTLPNAYYIVRVKTSRGTKTKKIFKQ